MTRLFRDFSLSALVAGFIATVISYAGPLVIIFQAAKSAGLPAEATPYSLRRSVATHLKRLNVPPGDISLVMGHKVAAASETTLLYIEVGDFLPTVRRGLERFLNEIGRVGARPIAPTVANPPRQRRCL